jgi:hypothetical protein
LRSSDKRHFGQEAAASCPKKQRRTTEGKRRIVNAALASYGRGGAHRYSADEQFPGRSNWAVEPTTAYG